MHLTQFTQMALTCAPLDRTFHLHSISNLETVLSMRLLESPCLRFFVVLYFPLLGYGTNRKWCCCWVIGPVSLPQYYFCSITMPQSNGRPTRCFQEVLNSNNLQVKMGISTTWGGGNVVGFGSFVTKLILGNPLLSIRKCLSHSTWMQGLKKNQVIPKKNFL